MEVKTKYEYGKTYYYNKMISEPYTRKCMFCIDGKHVRVADNKMVTCPVCKGVGEVETGGGSIMEEPRKCFLRLIKVTIREDSESIEYNFANEDSELVRSTIYETLEDCIKDKSNDIKVYTS